MMSSEKGPIMPAADKLSEHTGRVPFLPFFVKLKTGETIVVRKRFKAAAGKREFAVTTDGVTVTHIPYDEIIEYGLESEPSCSD